MNQEKNHWLALYLTGKYPGFFHTPDKLLFIDELQAINPSTFSDEKIKMFGMFGQVDEYEFYLSFLGKVERNFTDKFVLFLEKLNIPKEIRDQSIKKFFDHDLLLQEFQKVKADKGKTTKGKTFEEFLKTFFDAIDGLEVVEIKQASDEQIDLVIKNNVDRPFWYQLNSPLFLIEAKNHKDKIGTQDIEVLENRVSNKHANFTKLGLFFAVNGFTEPTEELQKRNGGRNFIISHILGEDIEKLLTEKQNPIDWLEERIISAFR